MCSQRTDASVRCGAGSSGVRRDRFPQQRERLLVVEVVGQVERLTS